MEQPSTEVTLKNLAEHLQKASELRDKKQLSEAMLIAEHCLRAFPNNPEIHAVIGVIQLDGEKHAAAEKSFQTAITLAPERADFYFLLGKFLYSVNRLQEAENAYLQCVKINKNHSQAIFNLANIYEKQGKLNEAIRAFNEVLKLKPDFHKAYYNLGLLYHKQDKLTNAIACYEKALEGNPNDISALSNLGAALTKDRQFKKAIQSYEKAIKLSPNYVPAMTNLGGTYIELEQFKLAEKLMRQSLAIDPNLPANWRNLSLCCHYHTLDNPDFIKINELLNNTKLTDEEKTHYYFALGKIYDDCQQYDKAFESYEKGNSLHARSSVFKPEAFKAHINRVINVFDETPFKTFTFENDSDPQPIFILGTPRAGKSLLEGLLTQFPTISGAGEIGFSDLSNKIPIEYRPKGNYPYWIKTLTFEEAQGIRDAYYAHLTRDAKKGDRYVIDTLPGNFMYLGLLAEIFPHAKIIFCQRNAFDLCLLMYFKYFVQGHGYSYDLKKIGAYYQEHQRLMNYWHKFLPQPIFELQYEELAKHPKKVLKSVMNYLALDQDFVFDVKKVKASYVGHWRHYEKYLTPLKQALQEDIVVVHEKDGKTDVLKDLMGGAYFYYDQGDTERAEMLAKTLIKDAPLYYSAYHLLGMIYHKRAEYDAAIEYFKKAIEISPLISQIHLDLANALKEIGKQMESESHLKIAEKLQQEKVKQHAIVLNQTQKEELLSAFTLSPQIIDEFETRLLLKGKIAENATTDSYMTRSWDQYFTDLSFGSFRTIQEEGKHPWRMRTWHFLFKNMALVESILNNPKPVIRILDIGCSTGYLRRFLEGNLSQNEKKKIYYWGVDIRQDVLETAVKGVNDIESGAKGNLVPSAFLVQDINHDLPFQDSFFDYVVSFEMIKYLPIVQGKKLIAQMYRILNPEGQLYLSTSYDSHQPGFMQSVPFEQLEKILGQYGFKILSRRGSQANFKQLIPHLKEPHLPLAQALLTVHPPEMVAAMLTPLYPECAEQVTFVCKIQE